MTERSRVLVVDDQEEVRRVLAETLTAWEHQVTAVGSGPEALECLKHQLFDAALVDIRMPGMDGLALLREIKRHDPSIEVVMITGHPEVSTAVQALKDGAYDYLTKPFNPDEARRLLDRTLERRRLQQEVRRLRSQVEERTAFKRLMGGSPKMLLIREIIARVAATPSPVLIEGESGTGKELAAKEIHRLSPRASSPFIPVNCSAIPGELLESELFGHVRGAFTGAMANALGVFRSATGGTVFLDEVAELPFPLQGKLLRFFQDGEVRPVGSSKVLNVDVRIIAATNRPLEEAVRNGSLRSDLFHRLNVVRLRMPPLRECKADIPALVAHFLRQLNQRFQREVKGIAPEALSALVAYDFPGNVRELENILERAYALGARDKIELSDLPPLLASPSDPLLARDLPTLAQAERELIIRALQLHANNRDQAALALGISLRTLYRRLREYNLL